MTASSSGDVRGAALTKGKEIYLFTYSDRTTKELLQTLAKFASNPELSFDDHDAYKIAAQVELEFCAK